MNKQGSTDNDRIAEQILKAHAADMQGQCQTPVESSLGYHDTAITGIGGSKRPTLRDRIRGRVSMEQCRAKELGMLQELQGLLHKNPDVARILELLEEVGV